MARIQSIFSEPNERVFPPALRRDAMRRRREGILWIEGIGFSLIISLAWVTEYFRVPHYLFSEDAEFNWGRALLRSVVIAAVWLAVHVATQRVLKRLHQLEEFLLVCAWCRKIGHEGQWMTMEEYFGSALSTPTTHGICPECSRNVKQTLDRRAERVR